MDVTDWHKTITRKTWVQFYLLLVCFPVGWALERMCELLYVPFTHFLQRMFS